MTRRPTVGVVAMGGTIACVPSADGGVMPSPNLDFMAGVLRQAVASSTDLPRTRLVSGPAVPSAALDGLALSSLLRQFEEFVEDGATGVVLTMGTDALEEVAFLIDLLWRRSEPVVLVGAMRHGGLPGGDGPANLRDGLRVAAAPTARDLGCLVVMSGQVHQAWQVRKAHTGQLSAFVSTVTGPVGFLQEDALRLVASSVISRPAFALAAGQVVPPVALVKTALDDDGRTLSSLVDLGYRGLVVEVMGGGSVPPAWMPHLERVVEHMPVVAASRTFAGPTLDSTYGGRGSELDLKKIGVLRAGLLDGLKARLVLGLLLATDSDRQAMESVWAQFDRPVASSKDARPLLGSP